MRSEYTRGCLEMSSNINMQTRNSTKIIIFISTLITNSIMWWIFKQYQIIRKNICATGIILIQRIVQITENGYVGIISKQAGALGKTFFQKII